MLHVLAALLFSYYFIAIACIPAKIKAWLKWKPHRRIKPFDCMTCLSAWSALAFYFLPPIYTEIACIMFGAGYLGSKVKI